MTCQLDFDSHKVFCKSTIAISRRDRKEIYANSAKQDFLCVLCVFTSVSFA